LSDFRIEEKYAFTRIEEKYAFTIEINNKKYYGDWNFSPLYYHLAIAESANSAPIFKYDILRLDWPILSSYFKGANNTIAFLFNCTELVDQALLVARLMEL
jgi:hypothetical protein